MSRLSRLRLIPILIVVLGVPFQSAMSYRLGIYGGHPDVSLTAVLVAAAFFGPGTGMALGFASGLLHGTVVGESIGTATIVRTLAGFGAGAAVNLWLQPGLTTAIAATIVGTLFEGLVVLMVNPTLANRAQVVGILTSTAWNTAVALAFAALISARMQRSSFR